MQFSEANLHIESDFEIRTVREDKGDKDLFIPIDNRTINLYLDGILEDSISRFQFSMVKGIVIRFSVKDDSCWCTVHLLRNIDLQSSIVNFELNYDSRFIEIRDQEYYIEFRLKQYKS